MRLRFPSLGNSSGHRFWLPTLTAGLGLLLLAGCAEVTRPGATALEQEAVQLEAVRRHPHQTWSQERVSRVFIRVLATLPRVHGHSYPFLGFNWWTTAGGKVIVDQVWSPSPAYDAGIKQGDVILSLGNWPLHPWVKDWDHAIKTTRAAFMESLPGEVLVSLMLDLKHLRMEAGGAYLTGPVTLLLHREETKIPVTLYPQHLPAEYGILVATKTPTLTAYAAPSWVIISHRFIEFCRTDDELALVIGHELAHQVLGHQARRAAQQELGKLAGGLAGVFTTLSLQRLIGRGPSPKVGEDIRRAAPQAVVSVFSQDDELEADAYGLWYAYQAGYDPDSALAILERLGAARSDPFEATYFLDSHPAPLERLARLKKIARYYQSGQAALVFLQSPDLNRKPLPELR